MICSICYYKCLLFQNDPPTPPPEYSETGLEPSLVKGRGPGAEFVVEVDLDEDVQDKKEAEEEEDPWALVIPKDKGKPWKGAI